MTAPCPVCRSTQYRKGFCCNACHALYMEEQRRKWSAPATAPERPDWPQQLIVFAGRSISPLLLTGSLPGRPDPCWHTDEQVGSWSRGVRLLEEGPC